MNRRQMLTLLLGLVSASACAGGGSVPWLAGDWGGARPSLLQQGFDFQLGYTSETAYNAAGGTRQETRYADQWTFGATVNLARLWGVHDAQFQLSITDRDGRNLSGDAQLGTLQEVQEIYGRGQSWRITDLWYQQKYFAQLLDWKLGRLTVGEDFASFPCDFQNLSFCGAPPGNIEGSYWYNWPVSQWATRLKLNLPADTYAQIGLYQLNPNYLTQRYAFNLSSPPGTTGALIPLEFGWSPKAGIAGLPGSYKLGGWYNTSNSSDVYDDIDHNPLVLTGQPALQRNGAYGAYLMFQQQLTRRSPDGDPKRGLSLFFNATQADRDTSTVDSQVALGLLYVGPFNARPGDDLGLAVARTHVNSRVADGERLENASGLAPVAVQTSEYASELYYSWHPLRGLILRPNLQYVYHPGGTSQNNDVVILGLKLVANI